MTIEVEKSEIAIIVAALDLYRDYLENDDHAPTMNHFPYTVDDVRNLFQRFDLIPTRQDN